MKKILSILSVLALVLTSCSSDDNSNDNSDSPPLIKVKKITYTYPGNINNQVVVFEYEGDKLISKVTDNNSYNNYTYTGNLITKEEKFINNVLSVTIDYIYVDGKLDYKIEKRPSQSNDLKTKYTYNADATISFKQINIKTGTDIENGEGLKGKYTYKDGNLLKFESYYYEGENLTINTSEYDLKNNPLKNILGVNSLIDWQAATANNITKEVTTSSKSSSIFTLTYSYNSDNFPLERKAFNKDGVLTATLQYTY